MKSRGRVENQEVLRLYLQSELVRRCKENPRYSLRAFARSLQMDFSTLSKILQGHRKLGPKATSRLDQKLGLRPDEVRSLLSPFSGNQSAEKDAYLQLANDTFEIISDW